MGLHRAATNIYLFITVIALLWIAETINASREYKEPFYIYTYIHLAPTMFIFEFKEKHDIKDKPPSKRKIYKLNQFPIE